MTIKELLALRLAHLTQCLTSAQRDGDIERVHVLEAEIAKIEAELNSDGGVG
jgi:hypothetical protein